MKNSLSIVLVAAATISSVDAHGFMSGMSIDGTFYPGNVPNRNANPSIIRQVNDISPVKGASNPDMNCGLSAPIAALVADANPGSRIDFNWSGGEYQRWPHNTGPMISYMASCGSTPCNQYESGNAKWFKIQQVGRKPDGNWAQADIMAGAPATITLPTTLAPGNYLIRHEIIALHNAMAEGGAEFYPACAQLRIGGSQNGAPANNELVTFPGGYSDTDPGIWDKSPYDPSVDYPFPGPQIAAFVGTSGTTNGGQSTGSGTATPTTTKTGYGVGATGVPTPTPTGQCRLKRNLALTKREQNMRLVRRKHGFGITLRNLLSGRHRRS